MSHPVRRALLTAVAEAGPVTVGTLADPLALSTAAVSKHLLVLERAALIRRRRAGRTTLCELAPTTSLRDAAAWLQAADQFWSPRLDRLAALLDTPTRDDHE